MKITAQEIANWREDPTTLKVFEYFRKLREDHKEDLSEGVHSNHLADAMAIKHSDIIGTCKAYKDILDISYGDFASVFNIEEKEEDDGLK